MDSWAPGDHTTQNNKGLVKLEKPQKVVKEEDRITSRDEREHMKATFKGTSIRKISGLQRKQFVVAGLVCWSGPILSVVFVHLAFQD